MRLLSLTVVLLQHANEPGRSHGTGQLLLHESMQEHLNVLRWTWSGRADNEQLQQQLQTLPRPALLWNAASRSDGCAAADDGASSDAPDLADADDSLARASRAGSSEPDALPCDYIIIDGTWQEALKIFRRGPEELQRLPRTALEGGRSTYQLRADFGWRERFGARGNAEPLCTAECAASLLEQRGADAVGGERLRRLLGEFQAEYMKSHAPDLPHQAQFARHAHVQPAALPASVRSCRWPERRYAEVNAFYARESYRRKAKRGDVVFVLRDADAHAQRPLAAIVGAVRCTPSAPSKRMYMLQSLCVARSRRRLGLGSALVAAAVADLGPDSACYCHCSEELRPMYEASGFEEPLMPPEWMVYEHELIAKRQSKRGGSQIILLMRDPKAATPG